MNGRLMLIFAALSGFFYVAFGAFGAHVLSASLGLNEMALSVLGWSTKGSIRW